MKFRTEFKPVVSDILLDPTKPLVLVGSCFTESIGGRMADALWPVTVNPCGVQYNIMSIGQSVINAFLPEEEKTELIEKSIVERDGIFLSWLFDSSIHAFSRKEYLEKALTVYSDFRKSLLEADALIVTLGTSRIYRLVSTGEVVANCHKFPASLFRRECLSVARMTEWAGKVMDVVAPFLNGLKVIITVSPVRHIADGFVGNSLSKASLLLVADTLTRSRMKAAYFPAFEILYDDLRDYRFYADDLCHPSSEAVEYIWEKFLGTYLDDSGRTLVRRGEALNARLRHRPLIPGSDSDKRFREETERLLNDFRSGRM